MAKDYYSILKVSRTATEDEIKKAFRKLAHEYHPDKRSGNEEKFKEINEAYQVLSSKEKRQQYDQFGTTYDSARRAGAGGWQDMRSEGANPFSGFSWSSGQGQQFDFGDLSDMFGGIFDFGNAQSSARNRARGGHDVETIIPITFEESYFGVVKEISLNMAQSCDRCNGSGNDPTAKVTTCPQCKGKGTVASVQSTFLGAIRTETVCMQCNGSGKYADKKCTACHGATVRVRQKTVKVKIPAGIDESNRIRLNRMGEAGKFGGSQGDLIVGVTISGHRHFKREGYDITSRENVPLSILSTGGSINVNTMTGFVKLKIPAATASGTTFILRGKGFEKLTGRGHGDQRVTVHVNVPQKLTNKQKQLLQEFEAATRSGSDEPHQWW